MHYNESMATTTFIINKPFIDGDRGESVKCGFADDNVWGVDHPTNWFGDGEVIDAEDQDFQAEMFASKITTIIDMATGLTHDVKATYDVRRLARGYMNAQERRFSL